jgi:surfeit locus 1 family protein
MFRRIFSREWILTTVLVLLGTGLCTRLGIWQLDRLEQRRAFNAHVEKMWAADPVRLPQDIGLAFTEMEYRSVCVTGEFDFDAQVALRNQYWRDQYGYHILTPLVMTNGIAVMVDRGWIPAADNETPEDWTEYNEPAERELCGIIRLGQDRPDVGGRPDPTLAPDQDKLDFWNNVNLERLGEQFPHELVPIYIQLDVDEADNQPPVPYQPEIELTEGPHLGYAGQWFTFAAILLFGYPFFVRYRERRS